MLFASQSSDDGGNLRRLAGELVDTSSSVVLVADYELQGTDRRPERRRPPAPHARRRCGDS